MKTKLTLTIEKDIVEKAKRKASSQGISLSRLFEKVFDEENPGLKKSPEQLAAARFLERLKNDKRIEPMDKTDKELIRAHRETKYR
jgi:hypothetical protein